MPASRPFRSPRPRPRRAALAVVVAVGYVAAFAGTPIGHGLQLFGHLAAEHATLAVEPGGYTWLDTEPEAHRHADGTAHAHRAARPEAATHDAHEHGGVPHTHEAPAPDPATAAASVDDHRPALAPAHGAPRGGAVAWRGGEAPPASVSPSVETPPPIGMA